MKPKITDCKQAITDVFYGDASEVPDQCKAMFQNAVYEAACTILERNQVEVRRQLIQNYPETIRDKIAAEVRRLFEYRKAQGKPTNQKC